MLHCLRSSEKPKGIDRIPRSRCEGSSYYQPIQQKDECFLRHPQSFRAVPSMPDLADRALIVGLGLLVEDAKSFVVFVGTSNGKLGALGNIGGGVRVQGLANTPSSAASSVRTRRLRTLTISKWTESVAFWKTYLADLSRSIDVKDADLELS
jgi:hypothetical protein